jgi:hypothetical protein
MTTKLFLYAASAAFLTITAQCATVLTSATSCTTNQGTVSGSSACNLAGLPAGSASADSSASYSISGNTLTISLMDDAYAQGTVVPGNPSGAANSASAQSDLSISIITAGPVRAGLVVPNDNGAAQGEDGRMSLYGGDGSGTAILSSFIGLACTSVSGCNYGSGYQFNDHPLPIMLGPEFTVNASATADAEAFTLPIGVYGDYGYSGHGSVSASFQFFEADGVTPVDIALATPEPSLGAFTGALSLFFACGAIRQKMPEGNRQNGN